MAKLQDGLNKIKADVQKTMITDVAPVVVTKEKEHIKEDVYNKYHIDANTGELTEPFLYERRYEDDGLISDNNIKVETTEKGIIVKNITKANGSNFDLAGLIENGDGYNGLEYTYKENRDDTAYQYLQSRPFMQNTKMELKQSKEHIEALKNGLKNKGYKVE